MSLWYIFLVSEVAANFSLLFLLFVSSLVLVCERPTIGRSDLQQPRKTEAIGERYT